MAKQIIILVVSILITLGSPLGHSATTPTDDVRGTVDSVIHTLKKGDLDKTVRRKKITSLIKKRFDFRVMSRQVLATNWKHATAMEKEKFISLFMDLLKNAYMERIEAYENEKVKYVKEKIRGKKARVDTLVITKSVEIPIGYKLFQRKDEWFVYDVVIEKVSLIRNYRSSYKEIVKKEGISGLLKKMEDKVDDMNSSKKRVKK